MKTPHSGLLTSMVFVFGSLSISCVEELSSLFHKFHLLCCSNRCASLWYLIRRVTKSIWKRYNAIIGDKEKKYVLYSSLKNSKPQLSLYPYLIGKFLSIIHADFDEAVS